MKLYDEAFQAAAFVVNAFRTGDLEGYPADQGVSLPWICQMAVNAGAGDHLEIGTSWGASAIAVALAKNAAGLPGKIWCIDPYMKEREHVIKIGEPDNLPIASISGVRRNIKKSELDIQIIRAKSIPFPDRLKDMRFVSAYVDGSHIGEAPYLDMMEVSKRVDYYIGTDNYEEGYPDVLNACHKFANGDDWNIFFKNFIFISFRKEAPPRNMIMSTRLEHT
jgi:hypothetical protein